MPYSSLSLKYHSPGLSSLFPEKYSNSSSFSPYELTSENKLNCVSALSMPKSVEDTSEVSGNCSSIFNGASSSLLIYTGVAFFVLARSRKGVSTSV